MNKNYTCAKVISKVVSVFEIKDVRNFRSDDFVIHQKVDVASHFSDIFQKDRRSWKEMRRYLLIFSDKSMCINA